MENFARKLPAVNVVYSWRAAVICYGERKPLSGTILK
jgi:hypothetical protein